MWDLPGPGLKPVSPALAGGFLTTEPPGKPTKPTLTCDPAITLLGSYTKELKTECPHRNLHMMFIAVLLKIAKTWMPPTCPSGWWMDKSTVVHPDNSGIFFSAKKELAIRP